MDPAKFSKEPTFTSTGLNSPITEFALGIVAHKDGKYYADGSAIIIAPYIAITAQHVINGFFRDFEGNDIDAPPNSKLAGTFHLQLFQILDSGKSGLIWNVTQLWSCSYTDIAIMRLTPTTREAAEYKWRLPRIDLIPPKLGERISCFGYRHPKIQQCPVRFMQSD
ncbi:hypothetical protein JCM30471_13400 [Desulfuromonas carbonis]